VPASSIGLAVFGAGRIGAVHVRNVARHVPGAHLVGISDIDRTAAQRLADSSGVDCVADAGTLLADPAVQGVIIATPTDTHAALIAQAADAGKHILCEKPISLSLSATRTAIDSAQKAAVILQVGFQRRFDEEFMRARRLVEEGAIGAPRYLRLVGRDHRMPSTAYLRTSGGQFKDQMVHEFDLARWLLAPIAIEEVYATGSALIDPKVAEFGDVDTSLVVLRFSNGALGVIDDSREAIYGYDVRGELHGSKGMVLVGQAKLRNGELLDARHATADVDSFIERFAEAYRAEVADFVSAIREQRAPRVSAHDALEAMRIAVAADRSFRLRRPVAMLEVTDD
jgi:myo-inositol 2-dehydrogenase / D-chiro-inositol 1-dehydrogenase